MTPPRSKWKLDTGTLHATVKARTMKQALVIAVTRSLQQPRPPAIGMLVRGRKICCAKRLHAPHFIHYWLDPIPTMRRAGLLR